MENKGWHERIEEAKTISELLEIKQEFELAIKEDDTGCAPYQVPSILNKIDSRIKEVA